jgi:hypothetical protein
MRKIISITGRSKKILLVILISANLLMLAAAIITIPPNLRALAGKDSPASRLVPERTGERLSTQERPDLDDFLWYTEDVIENRVPEGAQVIDNTSPVLGGWKGFILYDPDNSYGEYSSELLNVTIEGSDDNLRLTLDWYLLLLPGDTQAYDETEMEDIVFEGEWIAGGIQAFGWGEIQLRRLYNLDGKQYAVGSLETPDGTPALVALVRP